MNLSDVQACSRNLICVFQTLDRNEDGNLNYDEFKKLFEARTAMINGNAESQV